MAKSALNAEPDASLADIAEAVKILAAKARIRYGGDIIRRAIAAEIPFTRWRGPSHDHVSGHEQLPEPGGPTHTQAVSILAELQRRTGVAATIRSMPPRFTLRELGRFQARMVRNSIARCEALEKLAADEHES